MAIVYLRKTRALLSTICFNPCTADRFINNNRILVNSESEAKLKKYYDAAEKTFKSA